MIKVQREGGARLRLERPTRRWALTLWDQAAQMGLQIRGDMGLVDLKWPPPFGARMVALFPKRLRGRAGRVVGCDFGVIGLIGHGRVAPGYILLSLSKEGKGKRDEPEMYQFAKSDALPVEVVKAFGIHMLDDGVIEYGGTS